VYSPSYFLEINGEAEKGNNTLRNSAKTLMYWAKLPKNF